MSERKQKLNRAMFFSTKSILVVLLICVSVAVGILWQKVQKLEGKSAQANQGQIGDKQLQQPQTNVAPITDADYVKGNRTARIALIEYSDLECPFCKRFHPTAQQVIDEYPDDVMWVYRHFPLDQLHPKADKQAEATECAGKLAGNEGFWALTDKIFEVTPSNNGLDNSTLPDLAADVGINRSAFESCLNSGEMAQSVEEDYQSGLAAGVQGTPGNILLDTATGKSMLIPGAIPYPQLQQAVEGLLAEN